MTAPSDPPQDPWQSTPSMSPEQSQPWNAPPPGQPGQPGQPGWEGGGQYPPSYGGYPQGPQRNGLGTAALVLGILGLLSSWFFVGGVLGVLALIFGFIGRGRVKRGEANNGGLALAGIVLGLLAILVALFVLFVLGDELGSYTRCLKNATTSAEQAECERRFQQDVEGS